MYMPTDAVFSFCWLQPTFNYVEELHLQVRFLICYNFISASALKLHHYFKLFLTERNFTLLLMS